MEEKRSMVWDDVLSKRDLEVMVKAGYGKQRGLGKRPAIAVIDVTYEFVGLKPEPILQSIETFPSSCGEMGWQAVAGIAKLLPVARLKDVPVFYTTVNRETKGGIGDPWSSKKSGKGTQNPEILAQGKRIVKEVEPLESELVLNKQAPSIFCGTPLQYYLNKWNVDTLILTGGTTSGCVRASAVDAFSYGYSVAVVEEALFDRLEISHKVNLLDIKVKIGDVITVEDTIKYLSDNAAG